MRVALISTWETDCGIAGYSGKLVPALRDAGIEVDVLSIDRRELAYLTTGEMMAWWDQVAGRCSAADAVHIQHEFAFFAGAYGYSASARVFSHFLKQLRSNRVPVLTTFHTEPFFFRASRRANAELPVMAALVESNLQNVDHGDASSLGYFQMQTIYWMDAYPGYPERPDLQL